MLKTHFLITDTPHTFEQEATALCGTTIPHPETVAMVEMERMGIIEFNAIRDCAKCFRRAETEAKFRGGKTYLYALVEAQEAKNAQAESAA